jgi:ABC-type lipoprotein release transport system permease subunit
MEMLSKKFSASIVAILLTTIYLIFPFASSANATKCVQVKPIGKTIGQIQVGSLNMPIKPFNYPAGGIMEPQKSVQMAALSQRHMPLNSTMGTSVLVWHVDYAGCNNPLNVLTKMNKGYVFKVKDESGRVISYRIANKLQVKKGDYKDSWFNLIGPRQLLLATCGGAFKNGHYQDNVVLIARPI